MNQTGVQSVTVSVGQGELHANFSPARSPGAAVLMVPPFLHEWQRSYRLFALLSGALAERGISVLRFDYRGCGDSTGHDQDFLLSRALVDTERALDELGERTDAPITLLGIRAGALLAENVAERRKRPWVAWQPVKDGASHWNELCAFDQVERNSRRRFPFLRGEAVTEQNVVMGHRVHPELAVELGIFKPTAVPWLRMDAPSKCSEADLALPLECSRWVGQLDLSGSLPRSAVASVADMLATRLTGALEVRA